jgi:DNA mismatch endonuclease (patch repair protein)
MADVHSRETRSYNMSQIKSRDTKPEMLVRRFLHANGVRYKLHDKTLPGKPDIVLPKYKTIVDVRGCFWHCHDNCKYGDKIKSDSENVTSKVKSAVRRDKINQEKWQQLGWNVVVIWDSCELETKKKSSNVRENTLKNLLKKILQNSINS